jgi:hypothetical protein
VAGRSEQPDKDTRAAGEPESLAEVLASIRALVSAETEARAAGAGEGDTVLMLTPEMRVDRERAPRSGEVLAEGLEVPPRAPGQAPILDEESLRDLINSIVREELQGELGDRISRNLRKLIRREITQILEEQHKS